MKKLIISLLIPFLCVAICSLLILSPLDYQVADYFQRPLKPLNESEEVNMVNIDDIIVIQFISTDQKINCAIKTLKTDTFAEVEEKLYQKYPEYRETNNNFIFNGKIILRFKTVFENNIQDGDKIQLLNDV